MKWALLALLPAVAMAGGFGNSISSSGPVVSSSAPPHVNQLAGVGDSIMNGYGANSPLVSVKAALGPGAVVINAGNPGERSNQIAARWLATNATLCGPVPCTHVWFEGGVNDLRFAANTPAQIVANMTSAVDDALSRGMVVLWSDILPCKGDTECSPQSVTSNILSYNGLMATACSTAPRSLNPRLRCIFAYSSFEDPSRPGFLLPAYSRDELHLTNTGSAALGALAAAQLP